MQRWDVDEPGPGQDVAAGVRPALTLLAYCIAHAGSGGCATDPVDDRLPASWSRPPLHRSGVTMMGCDAAGAGTCDCCAGAGALDGLLGIRLAGPRSFSAPLDRSVPALAPASTRTFPELETDLTWEPEIVVAPQAALTSAAKTNRTRSLFIAIRITLRAPRTDGLDAA